MSDYQTTLLFDLLRQVTRRKLYIPEESREDLLSKSLVLEGFFLLGGRRVGWKLLVYGNRFLGPDYKFQSGLEGEVRSHQVERWFEDHEWYITSFTYLPLGYLARWPKGSVWDILSALALWLPKIVHEPKYILLNWTAACGEKNSRSVHVTYRKFLFDRMGRCCEVDGVSLQTPEYLSAAFLLERTKWARRDSYLIDAKIMLS